MKGNNGMLLWKELSPNVKKIVIGGSIAFFIGIFIGGYAAYADYRYQSEKHEIKQSLRQVENSGEIGKTVNKLSSESGFLLKGLKRTRLTLIQYQLLEIERQIHFFKKKYPKDNLDTDQLTVIAKKLEITQQKLSVQEAVNEMFQQNCPAIDGSTVLKDVVLEYNVDESIVEAINLDSFEKDNWKQAIQDLLTEAKYQLTLIRSAELVINDYYKEEKAMIGISQKRYEEVSKLVNKIKRPADKEVLKRKLTEIKKSIDADT